LTRRGKRPYATSGRLGGTHTGDYTDEGKTGTNINRPGFSRLLADARAGTFDAVVVANVSRLGRGKAYAIAEHELSRHGVVVVSATETFGDDPGGWATEQMTHFLNGMYPVMVKQWTLAAVGEYFRAGYHVQGRIPFGYLSVPAEMGRRGEPHRRLSACPDAAPLVSDVFALFAETRSITAVRERLAAASGKRWSNGMAEYLLTNRQYIGEAQWRGMVKESAHPAIVERSLFDAVQEILTGPGARRIRRAETEESAATYLLRGLLFCRCGRRLTPQAGTSRHGYVVPYYECPDRKGCRLRVNASHLHDSIATEIGQMSAHPWRVRRHLERAASALPEPEGLTEQIAAAERRARDAGKKVSRLTDALSLAPATAVPALVRRIGEEEEKRAAVAAEAMRLSIERQKAAWRPTAHEMMHALTGFWQLWQVSDAKERAHTLSLCVERAAMLTPKECEIRLLPGLMASFVANESAGSVKSPIMGPPCFPDRTRQASLVYPFRVTVRRSRVPKAGSLETTPDADTG
jgi:site-specific DNA recombinase